jgi:hypothetical protein
MARAKATAEVKKPAPRGSYATTAGEKYRAAGDYVVEQMPVILSMIMRARKLTIEDVGKVMGLSPSAVRHRLYGRTQCSLAEGVGLAAELEIDPRAFYDPTFPIEEYLRRG